MLKINSIPGVFYNDKEYINDNGEGAEIPVFIGKTGTKVDEIVIRKYNDLQEASLPVNEGGLMGDNIENPLLSFLQDFLARKREH